MSTWPDGGSLPGWQKNQGTVLWTYTTDDWYTEEGAMQASLGSFASAYLSSPFIVKASSFAYEFALWRGFSNNGATVIVTAREFNGGSIQLLELTDYQPWTYYSFTIPPGEWQLEFAALRSGSGDSLLVRLDDFLVSDAVDEYATTAWPVVIAPDAATSAWPVEVQAAAPSPVTTAWPVTVAEDFVATAPWPVRVLDPAVLGGLDGAGGWAAAPGGLWMAHVVLGGEDVSARVVGAVTVSMAEDAAATAEFSVLPSATIQPLELIGRRVRIAFAQALGANAQTIFSGVVEVPQLDEQTGAIRCTCHDQAQEILGALPREAIDTLVGGRWHVAVSGEPADNFEYLRERIQSVSASWALDTLQQPRVVPWRGLPRAVTVREADVLPGSLSVSFPSRADLRTQVVCRLQYRYEMLRTRGVTAQYSQSINLFKPFSTAGTSYPGVQWLTAAMARSACEGMTGWELRGAVAIEHPPARAWQIGTTIASGFYTITDAVAADLALGFRANYNARWTQAVTEDYTVTMVWPELEAQLGGPVSEEIGATLQAEFENSQWAGDSSVKPDLHVEGVGERRLAWQPAGFDAAARDEVMRVLLDRAYVMLDGAARTGRVDFSLPCRPDLWLDVWATVSTGRINAEGKIAALEHTLDTLTGRAVTEVALAVGMPGGVPAALPEWTLPAAPSAVIAPPQGSYSFEIGTYIGGDVGSPPYDEDEMIGFVTNLNGPSLSGREYYPHELSIAAPTIAAADRDPLDLPVAATINVSISTDVLEVL